MVATPYASGLAALVDDEVELGCAAIDMGAGTTTISVFAEGRLVHTDAISLGGRHVTTDLARGLSTRMEDAERVANSAFTIERKACGQRVQNLPLFIHRTPRNGGKNTSQIACIHILTTCLLYTSPSPRD